jgi:hypothetical protein
MRSPRFFAVDLAMNRTEFPERFANFHPDVNDVPFAERGDFLLAQGVHAGAASFSLRKSARAISA